MSPVDMEWLEEPDAERARRYQRTMMLSVVAHLFFFSFFYNASLDPSIMPYDVLTVDLVASVPMPAAPKPATRIEPLPETKSAAKPALAPPPPAPKLKILPKTAPPATARPARPEPVRRRPRPEELSYDDALAQLRNQLGESAPVETPPEVSKAEPQAAAKERPSEGIRVSPEVAAWILAVKRHVRSVWITPPEFRDARLATALDVDVSATGDVLGEPAVVRSSGNHFYDDNAVRAILKSSPLPAPPSAGRKRIIFTPQE